MVAVWSRCGRSVCGAVAMYLRYGGDVVVVWLRYGGDVVVVWLRYGGDVVVRHNLCRCVVAAVWW